MLAAWVVLSSLSANAQVAEACQDVERPVDYDEQVQRDFMANYFALATNLSPIHGPVPHEAGHGAIGVDLLVIPPLGCRRRFVLEHSKTEDTNRTPIAPRPRITMAVPFIGSTVLYGGFAYVPPIRFAGTRNVIVAGEVGVGGTIADRVQVGGRFHATLQKTVADIATAFEADDPVREDLFLASTLGLDAMVAVPVGPVTPFLAVGWVDASTFFWIGDDAITTFNLHPYSGLATSLGAEALVYHDNLRLGAEVYAAPGGHANPDPNAVSVKPASRYGHLYAVRFRVAWEL